MSDVVEISECGLCGCKDIPTIWDWGISPIANAFRDKEDLDKPEFQAPLVYCKCDNCHAVQLKFQVSKEKLYLDYLYESPPNLIPHFKELAKITFDYLGLSSGDKVVDIGSNNGLLLQEYKNLGCKVVGFEPCDRIAQKARDNGIRTFSQFFNAASAEECALQYNCPFLITSTSSFAHNSNINEFVEGIKILLDSNGYFVFEVCYIHNSLISKDLGQSYFDHYYQYSLLPLVKLFDKHGMEIFKCQYRDVQLGSIRCYVRFKKNQKLQKDNSVEDGIKREIKFGLNTLESYLEFKKDIDILKDRLVNKLKEIKQNGGTICLYAWSAKMSLINRYFNLEPYIDYIVEEAISKIGKFAPGTKLEIKNIEFFRNNSTTHCLLGAYNFEKDIKLKHQWYLGEWICPINP
jgi:SAM-dependent methyltransferase